MIGRIFFQPELLKDEHISTECKISEEMEAHGLWLLSCALQLAPGGRDVLRAATSGRGGGSFFTCVMAVIG